MRDTVKLPGSLTDSTRFDRWVTFEEGRTVQITLAGGNRTGDVPPLTVAAEELDLPLERVKMLSGIRTGRTSAMHCLSVMVSGASGWYALKCAPC